MAPRKITPLTTAQLVRKIQAAIDKGDLDKDTTYTVHGNMVTLKAARARYEKVRPVDFALAEWALGTLVSHVHEIDTGTSIRAVRTANPNNRLRYDRFFTTLHMDGERYGVRLYTDTFEPHKHEKFTASSADRDRQGRVKWYCQGCGQPGTLTDLRERGLVA